MKPKVLITSIGGFTGRYLANELAQAGDAVFGIGSAAVGGEGYFQADIEDGSCLQRVLAQIQPEVVHLAALAHVSHGDGNALSRIKLIGTRHLPAAIAEAAPRKDRRPFPPQPAGDRIG